VKFRRQRRTDRSDSWIAERNDLGDGAGRIGYSDTLPGRTRAGETVDLLERHGMRTDLADVRFVGIERADQVHLDRERRFCDRM
jgi:hypothetical protein